MCIVCDRFNKNDKTDKIIPHTAYVCSTSSSRYEIKTVKATSNLVKVHYKTSYTPVYCCILGYLNFHAEKSIKNLLS